MQLNSENEMEFKVNCEHCDKELYDHGGCYRRAREHSALVKQLAYTEKAYNDLRKKYIDLLSAKGRI